MLIKRFRVSVSIVTAFISFACVHTSEEKRKSDVERVVDVRIDAMEDNIAKITDTKNQQLSGNPREELNTSLDHLKLVTTQARSELKELKSRDVRTWLDKKLSMDKKLSEMDQSYSDTLNLITSH